MNKKEELIKRIEDTYIFVEKKRIEVLKKLNDIEILCTEIISLKIQLENEIKNG